MACPNCKEHWTKEDQGHFVPPSLGEPGFYSCIYKDRRRGFEKMGIEPHCCTVNRPPELQPGDGNSDVNVIGRKDIMVVCQCGEHWSHQANATDEQILSIYTSHLRYYSRTRLKPD